MLLEGVGVFVCRFHENFHEDLRKLFGSNGGLVTLSENAMKTRENFMRISRRFICGCRQSREGLLGRMDEVWD